MSVNYALAGFLFIDKPVGPTSHDVVDKVRRALGGRRTGIKVGHAGTLDPLASGLLVIGVGATTKLLSRLVGLPKTYEVEITLGATSATDDAEGPIQKNPNDQILGPRPISPGLTISNDVEQTLKNFIGEQEQIPPTFSAKKQEGQRLYKIARRGNAIAIKSHRITIFNIELVKYEYPRMRLKVHCSSGTYIRALARDIGSALKTGGYVSVLRRTAIGPFVIAQGIPLEKFKTATPILQELHNQETVLGQLS